jgi:hypothetical protein
MVDVTDFELLKNRVNDGAPVMRREMLPRPSFACRLDNL